MKYLSFLLLATMLALPSFAEASSVLLPEDNKQNDAPSGNMGLLPQSSPVKPTVSAPKTTPRRTPATKPSASQRHTTIRPGGALAPRQLTLEERFLASQLAAGKTPKHKKLSPLELRIKAYHEEKAKKRERDPTIMDDIPIPKIDHPEWKSGLGVAISESYLWGPKETKFIEKRLGYTAAEIPRNCQLKFDLKLVTNTEKYKFSDEIWAGSQSLAKYDDSQLQDVTFQPFAICNQPRSPLPRNGGIITRIGDKYSLQLLGTGNCELTDQRHVPRYLEVQYLGDGKFKCKYR